MKKIYIPLIAILLFVSCNLQVEKDKSTSTAVEEFVAKFLKGEHEAIYEDMSIETKANLSKELYLNIVQVHQNLMGTIVDAKLDKETSGEYKATATNTYEYLLKNEAGQTYNMTAEFLRGHLLKHFITAPLWSDEPAFAKQLVNPVEALVKDDKYTELYNLLDQKYPEEQVQSLVSKIRETTEGVANTYESYWIDNDKSGRMMVVFVYAYEAKGYLDYRFFIGDNTYPLAGIFFTPDAATTLP